MGTIGEIKLIIKPDADLAEAAEIWVEGSIDGRVYQFLLDTGAGQTSITFDDYTATFASVEKHHSAGVFASSSDDLITLPNIQVGPLIRDQFVVARMPSDAPHVRNLIGMDLLKDYAYQFFFREKKVLVGNQPGDDHAFQELLLDKKFHPYINVKFSGATGQAVWDTGASLTIVDTHFIQKHAALFTGAGNSTGTDSTGTSIETAMYRMAECRIGEHVFPPHLVAAVDLSPVNSTLEMPMDLILGYSTLSQVNWLFDFPRKRWAILK